MQKSRSSKIYYILHGIKSSFLNSIYCLNKICLSTPSVHGLSTSVFTVFASAVSTSILDTYLLDTINFKAVTIYQNFLYKFLTLLLSNLKIKGK